MENAETSYEAAWRAMQAGDHAQCIAILREAVERDDDACRVALAELYLEGCPGLPKDAGSALELLHAAAARTNITAISKLGHLYFNGVDEVPADYRRGFELTRFAAMCGHVDSMSMLGAMYGLCGAHDHGSAWFAIAAHHGDQQALRMSQGERLSPDGVTIYERYLAEIQQISVTRSEDPQEALRRVEELKAQDIPTSEPSRGPGGCLSFAGAALGVTALAALLAWN